MRYSVSVDGTSMFAERTGANTDALTAGKEVRIEWEGDDVLAFRPDGSRVTL